jgi:hypothetical protein
MAKYQLVVTAPSPAVSVSISIAIMLIEESLAGIPYIHFYLIINGD